MNYVEVHGDNGTVFTSIMDTFPTVIQLIFGSLIEPKVMGGSLGLALKDGKLSYIFLSHQVDLHRNRQSPRSIAWSP